MFKRILLIIATVGTATAQAGEAEKFFTERSKDFGTVPYGPALVHHFKITNTSNKNVQVTGATVSCGCVTPTLLPVVLKPGEHTFVTASMDTKRFVAHKEVTVFVNFASPREQVTLTVRANRNDNFSMSAENIVMGQVRKGLTGTASLQITMRNDANFQLQKSWSATDFVTPQFNEVRRDRSEVVYEVSANLKPGLDVGVWSTEMVFNSSNPTQGAIRVPVVVEVVAPITATPASVQFPSVKVGDTKEMSVVVKGEKPFKILDVKGGDGLITAVADGGEAKQAHIVRLVFQPSEAGEMSKTITVTTDDGSATKITIPVRGKVRGQE